MRQMRTADSSQDDFKRMAQVLVKRHNLRAFEVAVGFAREHREIGDEARAHRWDRVITLLLKSVPVRTVS